MEEKVLTWNMIEDALAVIEQARKEGRKAYRLQMSEPSGCGTLLVVFPRVVPYGDDYEAIYAMQEIKDEIERLKVGENMYFQPSRDEETSKGIITRIL